MSELMAELEEAVKRERLENFWKRYGNFILFAVLAVILGTGGFTAYDGWKDGQKQAQTDRLLAAIDTADPVKLVEASASMDAGLAAIAKARAAAAYMTRNEESKALPLYQEIAKTESYPKEFRNLGAFMAAKLTRKEKPAEAITAFEAMSADVNNPFRFHAHIEAALLLVHTQQDFASALKHLDLVLAEKEMTKDLRVKAEALRVVYSLKEKAKS